MAWTPHDLPFIVERASMGYRTLAEFWQQQTTPDAPRLYEQMNVTAAFLENPPLSWLDSDMCAMLSDMWADVPTWTPASCTPGPSGLIAFEKPILTAPYESAYADEVRPVPVRAIGWRVSGSIVRITAWAWNPDVPTEIRSPIRTSLDLEELLAISLSMHDIIDETSVVLHAAATSDDEAFNKAATSMQALVGSTWLLMTQPKMVTDEPVTMKVRQHRSGRTVKTPVRVSVRKLSSPPPARSARGAGRKATSRWWVRGHWRQQAWGKNRAFRKPIFIAPHTAGNADAPIDHRPKIQVWRTGDAPETSSEATEGPSERN